ncbi:hypothetical protein RAS1_36690 [Phycisphaerae bacterium RAS1]|nr:hypothetical protein RAS1_36690 [Phycisphaerae bacterium RAS1]
MTIESGPAKGERNYWLVVLTACLLFSGWFVRDGLSGYPNKCIDEARKNIVARMQDKPDRVNVEALIAKLGRTMDQADFDAAVNGVADPAAVRSKLGEPLHVRPVAPGETVEYFGSIYGMGGVAVRNGQVDATRLVSWKKWFKTREEVVGQLYFAVVPLVFALFPLWKIFKAVTLRVRVDENGIVYGGATIPMSEVVSVRDYHRKGVVDMYYRAGGQERKLRFDNQKVARFDEVVKAICTIKRLPNPIEEYYAAKQREEADDDQDASGDAEPRDNST